MRAVVQQDQKPGQQTQTPGQGGQQGGQNDKPGQQGGQNNPTSSPVVPKEERLRLRAGPFFLSFSLPAVLPIGFFADAPASFSQAEHYLGHAISKVETSLIRRLADEILEFARVHNETIVTAESCSAGMLALAFSKGEGAPNISWAASSPTPKT